MKERGLSFKMKREHKRRQIFPFLYMPVGRRRIKRWTKKASFYCGFYLAIAIPQREREREREGGREGEARPLTHKKRGRLFAREIPSPPPQHLAIFPLFSSPPPFIRRGHSLLFPSLDPMRRGHTYVSREKKKPKKEPPFLFTFSFDTKCPCCVVAE